MPAVSAGSPSLGSATRGSCRIRSAAGVLPVGRVVKFWSARDPGWESVRGCCALVHRIFVTTRLPWGSPDGQCTRDGSEEPDFRPPAASSLVSPGGRGAQRQEGASPRGRGVRHDGAKSLSGRRRGRPLRAARDLGWNSVAFEIRSDEIPHKRPRRLCQYHRCRCRTPVRLIRVATARTQSACIAPPTHAWGSATS